MPIPDRRRGGRQLAAAAVTCVLAVVTAVVPNWIEVVFGVDPDGGGGWLETAVVIASALATVVLGTVGAVRYRHSAA